MSQVQSKIRITSLKDLALKLEENHPLKMILLAEEDEMSPEEYLSRIRTWLRLLNVRK